jgi:myosin heavy subunit
MSKMQHIHEPAILHNLSRRFLQRQQEQQFYTYIGRNVLVSLNPLSWKYPDIDMESFFRRENFEDCPHPFVLAGAVVLLICLDIKKTCLLGG